MLLRTLVLGTIFVVAMLSFGNTMEVPITRHFTGGFQSDFCRKMPIHVTRWKAHIVFSHAVDSFDISKATVVDTSSDKKDYTIVNEDYDGRLEAGEELCLKFTVHSHNSNSPTIYFYIEGLDHPIDSHGHTHPIPKTTVDPQLAGVHPLWSMKNIPNSETDPFRPFDAESKGQFDEGSLSISSDPAGNHGKVLKVFYQKGHYVSIHNHRGSQFYSRVVQPALSMTLSYDLYFSPGFDFVKGGKLPGLFGGATNCSGGRHSDACFSTRLMWRTHGDGEVYGYIPREQTSDFCSKSNVMCNFDYGNSIGRGSWRFETGKWQNIAIHVTLNTPKQTNGKVKVWFKGQPVLEMDHMNFRNSDDIKIEGLFFSTFFGGSDPSWAPSADCYTYYKNFVLSSDPNHPAIIG